METLEPSENKHLSVAGSGAPNSSTVFEVSEVPQANKPLPEVPYYEAIEALLQNSVSQRWRDDTVEEIVEETTLQEDEIALLDRSQRTIESCSEYRGRLVAFVQFHPFVAAIHMAFEDHRPLSLSPDMIWLLIAQGLANHINANAEQLRSQFVKHQGKLEIKIRRDDFVRGTPENPWTEVFEEFSAAIRQHIGDTTHDLLMPTFSTTGLVERAATEIVLLDAMQSYFDYKFVTECGIPKLQLEGTITDWQDLVKRTKELARYGLDWWINALIPILEQFITAFQGKPDRKFWQSIYKYDAMSGGTYITGWITAFFPYLKDRQTGKMQQRNHYLAEGGRELQELLYPDENDSERFFFGLTTDKFPSGLSKAPFIWKYFGDSYNMEFLGGFVGVRQDANELFLRPEIGWAIREATAP